MTTTQRSLAGRLILAAGLWTAIALLAAGLILSTIFRDTAERAFDRQLRVLLEALVAASEVGPEGQPQLARALGEPRFERPYSGWYWQINSDDGTALARSASLFDQALATGDATVSGTMAFFAGTGPNGEPLQIAARDIRFPDLEAPLRYIVAANPVDVESDVARFNGILAIALVLLGLGLVSAIFVQVRFGLVPLRRLGEGLAAIRHGRASRLDTALPREIAPLATELNALLDHNERLVERARTHAGNLAHGLKTPLSILTNAAAPQTDEAAAELLGDTVRRQTAAMQQQIDHHLARARAAGAGGIVGARCPVAPVVMGLVRALGRLYEDRGLDIAVDVPDDLAFRGERQDLEEMVGNLADNACKWAACRVAITATAIPDGRIRITVDDDGNGLSDEQRAMVMTRGRRLDETKPGSGLGLAIVDDLAALYG
ncbi:MAG: ATP-binding protein, partial [Alphaproteobacteria bacterium]